VPDIADTVGAIDFKLALSFPQQVLDGRKFGLADAGVAAKLLPKGCEPAHHVILKDYRPHKYAEIISCILSRVGMSYTITSSFMASLPLAFFLLREDIFGTGLERFAAGHCA
jgi:hypothetical protein